MRQPDPTPTATAVVEAARALADAVAAHLDAGRPHHNVAEAAAFVAYARSRAALVASTDSLTRHVTTDSLRRAADRLHTPFPVDRDGFPNALCGLLGDAARAHLDVLDVLDGVA